MRRMIMAPPFAPPPSHGLPMGGAPFLPPLPMNMPMIPAMPPHPPAQQANQLPYGQQANQFPYGQQMAAAPQTGQLEVQQIPFTFPFHPQ